MCESIQKGCGFTRQTMVQFAKKVHARVYACDSCMCVVWSHIVR